MQPIYSPLPSERTAFLVSDLLDGEECARLVADGTPGFRPTGRDYPASYRDNDRLVRDDPGLAAALFARLRAHLPERLDGARLVGLNPRFRFCRYRDGQRFRVHRDGAHAEGPRVRSRLTVQVYLDEGFAGGRTRFFGSRFGEETFAVSPRRGTAIVFDHALWHDGEPVTQGTKHVLRTDVLYEDELEPASSPGHLGYVYAVLPLADGRVASGARDRTVRVWGDPAEVRHGHRGSIHALCEPSPGTLLSGSRDHTVRALDGSIVLELDAAVLCLHAYEGGVAVGAGDGVLRVMQGRTLRELRGHEGWLWALTSVAGRLLSGGEDGAVRVWNEHGCVDATNPGRGAIHALARIDDRSFAAGFGDGAVVIYELRRDRLSPVEVLAAHQGEVYALAALPEGLLASGGEDCAVRVHRLRDRALITEVSHDDFVRALAVTRDGRLLSGGYDGAVRWLT